jgi:hypothetical protein
MEELLGSGYLSRPFNLARSRYAMQQAGRDTIPVPPLREIEAIIATKFPQADVNLANHSAREADPLLPNQETAERVIQGLNKQAASGVSGLQFAVIKRLCAGSSDVIKRTILPLFRAMITGAIPRDAMDMFTAARLVLIPKGDDDHRPIGILGALVRVLNKTLAAQLLPKLISLLVPFNLAAGVRDGAAVLTSYVQSMVHAGKRKRGKCHDVLSIDIQNAYNTIDRAAILRALRKYAPQLVPWFLIQYGRPNKLLTSEGHVVGAAHRGILQGDPLSPIYFALGTLESFKRIDAEIKAKHGGAPHTGCRAFADDGFCFGRAEVLVDLFEQIKGTLKEETGTDVNAEKCVLLCTHERAQDDPAVQRAAQIGLKTTTNGLMVMGVPVGTAEFVDASIGERATSIAADLPCLKYFEAGAKWSILLHCINTRAAYLQRTVPLQRGNTQFQQLDKMIDDAVLNIMQVPNFAKPVMRQRVQCLARLSLKLSGGTLWSLASTRQRVKALRLTRESVGRFITAHDPAFKAKVFEYWDDPLPITSLRAAELNVHRHEPMFHELGGHPLGNVPPEFITPTTVQGTPNLETDHAHAIARIKSAAFASELWEHTQLMRALASDPQNKPLVAQCLSSSCVNSGHILRWFPTRYNSMPGPQFVQLLRTRFGVPCAFPLRQWKCPCTQDSFAESPLHILCCKNTQGRMIRRHDMVRDKLVEHFNRMDGISAITIEPNIGTPHQPGLRADIRLTHAGTVHMLDVSVTCPAAPSANSNAFKVAGIAARKRYADKIKKYAGCRFGIQPIVLETGGRIHPESCKFIDRICGNPFAASKLYKDIVSRLVRYQSYMIAKRLTELTPHRMQ